MCGIAGMVAAEGAADAGELRAMASALAHRGPDGQGVFARGGVGLAHARLAVLDRAGGAQPVASADGRVVLVFNGQVYNHRALGAGWPLRTRCDAEVVAEGIAREGPGFVRRMRGMFALAAYCADRDAVLLARDPMGIKPLYYRHDTRGGRFASEAKALGELALDPHALARFVLRGFSHGRSAFAGVQRVAPGEVLWLDARGVAPALDDAVAEDAEEGRSGGERETTPEAFLASLRDAVRMRLQGDEAPAVLLSGGVDSAAVAALAAQELGRPPRAYTLVFAQGDFDERAAARRTARHLGLEHVEVPFDPASVAGYPALLRHMEEWTAVLPAAQAMAELYRAVRADGVRAVLTGQGSDEVLGGYDWYHHEHAARVERGEALPAGEDALWNRFTRGDVAREAVMEMMLFTPEFLRARGPALPAPRVLTEAERDAPPLLRLSRFERRTRLADYVLHELDRASMLHAVEARVPFLDVPTVALADRARDEMRLDKQLLRRAVAGLLPEGGAASQKHGFVSPAERMVRDGMVGFAERALSLRALETVGVFQPAVVARMRERARAGSAEMAGLMLRVLNVQLRMGA